ncbi:S-layer homology domain-containing protein [Ammoniphilus sp. YIM 78166]|uniref:S-layer homology domain-containing protein n=1 Tax=Ammoniphilus sp. YIM 78166 TaxID=1644106 RepID=UPI00106FF700|nr:S-layer homology domain-containing protein [Ammoniphilus sp. YIM 78166]
MKKLAKSLLASSLLAGSLLAPYPYAAAASLMDIQDSYAKDAILELASKGILAGVGDGRFNPSGNISRQDFAIILAKALNLDVSAPPVAQTFKDIPTDHYAYAYVEAATKAGIISGMGNGQFGVASPLTREQIAVLFVRAVGVDPSGYGEKLTFADSASVSSWAKDAVGFALEAGLVSPSGNGFNPRGLAERQQVALVASNFMEVTTPASIESTERIDNHTIQVAFSKKVYMVTPANLALFNKVNGQTLTIEDIVLSEDKKGATIKVAEALPSNATLTLDFKDTSPFIRKDVENKSSSDIVAPAPAVFTGGGSSSSRDDGPSQRTNRVPVVVDGFGNRSMIAGAAPLVINLSGRFTDPDGDVLTLTAGSSNSAVATVSVDVSELTLTPLGVGSSVITITANDGKGGITNTTFTVTVQEPNQAPTVTQGIADQTKTAGDVAFTFDLAAVFEDAEDGDNLTWNAVSSTPGVASVSITGNTLTVTPLNAGTTTITVTATDSEGETVTETFTVTVQAPNQAPTVTQAIDDLTKTAGDAAFTFDLAVVFEDAEDGDNLIWDAVSSTPGVATVSITGNTLTVTPLNAGSTTITLTATDSGGKTVTTTFTVTVDEASNPPEPISATIDDTFSLIEITFDKDIFLLSSGDESLALGLVYFDPAYNYAQIENYGGVAIIEGNKLIITGLVLDDIPLGVQEVVVSYMGPIDMNGDNVIDLSDVADSFMAGIQDANGNIVLQFDLTIPLMRGGIPGP